MRRTRGFTLVELAIVVTIVGVLSVLAVVGYRRYRAKARTAEATKMIGQISAAQHEYRAERGVFADVSDSIYSFYPNTTPTTKVTDWGGPCTNCAGGDANGWQKLHVQATGPVMYGYSTVALLGAPPAPPEFPNLSAPSSPPSFGASLSTEPNFTALARGDTDGDGVFCTVIITSQVREVFVHAEGE